MQVLICVGNVLNNLKLLLLHCILLVFVFLIFYIFMQIMIFVYIYYGAVEVMSRIFTHNNIYKIVRGGGVNMLW